MHIYVVEPWEGEFVTRPANTQAAVGDAFAQMAGWGAQRASPPRSESS
jgi:hypothetical protein